LFVIPRVSPNPAGFIHHLRERGYHPRSDKHSNILAESVVSDLMLHCRTLREKAARAEVVYDLNFDLTVGRSTWNVDLVLGSPQLSTKPVPESGIIRDKPSSVQVAIEIKSVMTEHKKAVKNRKRDLEAHHEHVHNYNNNTIAGGMFVINGAETFQSPLRQKITTHRNPTALVEHCLSELRSVATRGGPTGYGLEAQCAIIVSVTNTDEVSEYMSHAGVPQPGDPLHYDTFIRRICDLYQQRFSS
jgi:hypothetical protein